MLTCLTIRHFLLIDDVMIHFNTGMSALTGETGAGKSIVCDALTLIFGAQASKHLIQTGHDVCEIKAHFDYQHLPNVRQWLLEHKFLSKNDKKYPTVLEISRCISKTEGTRAYLNGKRVKIQQLKLLSQLLIAIQSQYDQQRLLKQDFQRECVDYYGQHIDLAKRVAQVFDEYQKIEKRRIEYASQLSQQEGELQLLSYELQEIENIQFEPNELFALEQAQSRLANVKQIREEGAFALNLLHAEEPVYVTHLLKQIKHHVYNIVNLDTQFQSILDKIDSLEIQTQDIWRELHDQLKKVIPEPERLLQVEERLIALNQLARKHNVAIEALPMLAENLKIKYNQLTAIPEMLLKLEKEQAKCFECYQLLAQQLTHRRQQAAQQLQKAITEKIQALGMAGGQFEIRLTDEKSKTRPTRYGYERIEFYLSSTSGQTLQALAKTASGGELSRIYLIIQTLIAQAIAIPTLIFDEIDTGIGGSIAERMGLLLDTLGRTHQVICITHLPQVASLAQHHYQIMKRNIKGRADIQVDPLSTQKERIIEIARMLGGIEMTDQTITYAKAMLNIK